jgi:hypothetical protein
MGVVREFSSHFHLGADAVIKSSSFSYFLGIQGQMVFWCLRTPQNGSGCAFRNVMSVASLHDGSDDDNL